MEFAPGKLQPQASDLEEAILGSMLLDKNCIPVVLEILNSSNFYKEVHQKIFNAIFQLFNSSQPADILTVTQQLKRTGELDFVGGVYAISQLTNRIASSANIEFYARIVSQKSMQRELIKLGNEVIIDSFHDKTDVFDTIEKMEKGLTEIVRPLIVSKTMSSADLAVQTDKKNKIIRESGGVTGITTGFIDFDKKIGGWQKSDLIILAARPGMGKTALATQLLSNPAIKNGKATAIFSLEMSGEQLYMRMKSQRSGIILDKFIKYGLNEVEVDSCDAACKGLYHAPIDFDDTGGITLSELKNKARKLKRNKNIELIVIDYLQLIRIKDSKGNREQEISTISRELKALAKELNIPIICLSQLSREVEKRGGAKIPTLSDLRESGAIEQDADMVVFIYRPEYYGHLEDGAGNDFRGKAQIIIAKHRNGSLGDVILGWNGACTRFSDINAHYFDEPPKINPIPPNTNFENESKINNESNLPF